MVIFWKRKANVVKTNHLILIISFVIQKFESFTVSQLLKIKD